VSPSVYAKMHAVQATTVREDGLLLRFCEHGVTHPVGHLHFGAVPTKEAEAHAHRCCPSTCCLRWMPLEIDHEAVGQ
jgi:hypothetical protein